MGREELIKELDPLFMYHAGVGHEIEAVADFILAREDELLGEIERVLRLDWKDTPHGIVGLPDGEVIKNALDYINARRSDGGDVK